MATANGPGLTQPFYILLMLAREHGMFGKILVLRCIARKHLVAGIKLPYQLDRKISSIIGSEFRQSKTGRLLAQYVDPADTILGPMREIEPINELCCFNCLRTGKGDPSRLQDNPTPWRKFTLKRQTLHPIVN
ncbi:hypothetical protein [Pseudoduganella lutea]|uniref:Uncharacterized protein n=1 Tax=Pseudoduganella lutea TaxID=321985 RepID=A0A4P6KSL3_9BURK|nr:hypothetical protein [Pseudoduganella lutea]QBE62109.1 hypothetical protein EWM63_03195 [Pseudoduganella lutea]